MALVALLFSSVVPVAAQAGGEETARADELRDQLNTHLRQALEMGYEMQEFGGKLLSAIDPEKAEEAPQLLIELSQLETKLGLAQGDIDSALAIIGEAKGLNIPDWYKDYFAEKEQVANHLSAAFEEAERFLPRVVPLLETMPGVYRSIEEAGTGSQEIARSVASMSRVGFEDWALLGQKVSELEQIFSATKIELDRAYAKLPAPFVKGFSDLLVLVLDACGLLKQAIDAGQAGDTDRAQTLARQVIDILQGAQSPQMEESLTWFMAEYGAPMVEFKGHLEQAGAANAQAEMAFGKVAPTPTLTPSPTPSPIPLPAPIPPGRVQQEAQQFNQQLEGNSRFLLSGLSPSISYQVEALRDLQSKLKLLRGYLSQPLRSTLDWQLRERILALWQQDILGSLPATAADLERLREYIGIATDLGYPTSPQLHASLKRTEDTVDAADVLLSTELPTLPGLTTPVELEATALRTQIVALSGELESMEPEYEELELSFTEWLAQLEPVVDALQGTNDECVELGERNYRELKKDLRDLTLGSMVEKLVTQLSEAALGGKLPGLAMARKVLPYTKPPALDPAKPHEWPLRHLEWFISKLPLGCMKYYADKVQGRPPQEQLLEWTSLGCSIVSAIPGGELPATLVERFVQGGVTAFNFLSNAQKSLLNKQKTRMVEEQMASAAAAQAITKGMVEQIRNRPQDLRAEIERKTEELAQLHQRLGVPGVMPAPSTALEESALGGAIALEGTVESILEEEDPRCSLAWQGVAITLDMVKMWASSLRNGEGSLEYWRSYSAVDPVLGRQGEEIAKELMRTATAMLQLYLEELRDRVLEAREAWPLESSLNTQMWNEIYDTEAKLREVLGKYPWLRVEVAELPVELEEFSVELEEFSVELEEFSVELEELHVELLPLHTEVKPLLE